MPQFALSRLNMVNGQLLTSGIARGPLSDAYTTLPRERFVDGGLAGHPYVDGPLKTGKNWVLEPLVEARMIQAALQYPAHNALVLGTTNLPMAVMLAGFVADVAVLEADATQADIARTRLHENNVTNVNILQGDVVLAQAYDIICVPGAVTCVPPVLLDQLEIGGCLVCVVRAHEGDAGRIILTRKISDNQFDARIVADGYAPYIAGLEPAREFSF